MQRHYSHVGMDEKRAAIAGVIRLVQPEATVIRLVQPETPTAGGTSGGTITERKKDAGRK